MSNGRQLHRSMLGCAVLATSLAVTMLVGAGPASATSAPYGSCAAVQVIGVRGTGEVQPGGSMLPPLAAQITSRSRQTVLSYGLPYPATSDWSNSVTAGTRQLASRLSISAAYCPSQRFVLAGYSQGAWVVGDALAGGDGTAATISSSLGSKVAAVVLYGDPRFQAGQSYDTGTFRAGVSGVIPRPKGALSAYASRIRSYCYADDPICQNGATGSGHSRYTQVTGDAASFGIAKIGS